MRSASVVLILLVIAVALPGLDVESADAASPEGSEPVEPLPTGWLSVRLADTLRVEISLAAEGRLAPGRIALYRSSSWFEEDPDTLALPVTVREFVRIGEGIPRLAFVDTMVAHNVRYYYRARLDHPDGSVSWAGPDSVDIPGAKLGPITGSSLLVDKNNYYLAVRCGGVTRKRYPVALGGEPRRRKLHRDSTTTPEGTYRITAVQVRARQHKAFDLDYPNEDDKARYHFHRAGGLIPEQRGRVPAIGGGIQIHGGGIGRNWTSGSIALRNEDIDELVAHPRVGRGMPVYITGTELNYADIHSILDYRSRSQMQSFQRILAGLGLYHGRTDGRFGNGMRAALAAFQRQLGLPITGQLDRRTSAELSRE